MIKSDHISPNVSRAKLIGQSERLWCVCFIVKCFPRLPLVTFDDVRREELAGDYLSPRQGSPDPGRRLRPLHPLKFALMGDISVPPAGDWVACTPFTAL